VSGSFKIPGSPSDFDDARLGAMSEGIGKQCGLSKDNVELSVTKKAGEVTIVFVIYIPESATTITISSVTSSLADTAALLAAINAALTSAGFSTISGISVVFDPSTSPTPSPSMSASASFVDHASSSKNDELSDGAIAGIVIGSVFGAAILVALIVFMQMRMHDRRSQAQTNSLTAPAIEAEAAKGGKNSIDAQL